MFSIELNWILLQIKFKIYLFIKFSVTHSFFLSQIVFRKKYILGYRWHTRCKKENLTNLLMAAVCLKWIQKFALYLKKYLSICYKLTAPHKLQSIKYNTTFKRNKIIVYEFNVRVKQTLFSFNHFFSQYFIYSLNFVMIIHYIKK